MKYHKFLELLQCGIYFEENPKVVIRTNNKSIGHSSFVEIEDLYGGFDWDAGILFINPKEPLVKANLNRDKALEPINLNNEAPFLCDSNSKRTVWLCRNCEAPISIKKDNYCRNCGQKLKEVEKC